MCSRFFGVSHTIQSGTAACVEVHAHFDTPTQCPPILPRVIVTMIFNVSELVHMTCVFTYVQSDYSVVNMCINTLYRYICALDMCYSLNVMGCSHVCVYTM
jgi:hypothetical protein